MSARELQRYELKLGSRGQAVRVVKELLHNHPRVSYQKDGADLYDAKLVAAVAAFQKMSRLQVTDGAMNKETWAALGKGQTDLRLKHLTPNDPVLYRLLKGDFQEQSASGRNFLIVCGDRGITHNVGDLFIMAAATHEKEVKTRVFPNIPAFGEANSIRVVQLGTVGELVKEISGGDIGYLAYFGHAGPQALYIGEESEPDTNLSNSGGRDDTPVSALAKDKFGPGAQVRIFGCKAGSGSGSVAEQLARHLGIKVYAYTNSGGSLFTQDKTLGHGKRAVTKSDIAFKAFKRTADTWLVPINGTPTFKEF